MPRPLSILVIVLAVAVAGCGGEDEGPDGGAATGGETTTEAEGAEAGEASRPGSEGARDREERRERRPGTTIATAGSQLGEVLFDADDQAIYYFDVEATSESECYGECAEAWPPVLTEGEPRAAGGARRRLLGTTEREDGSTQVTYAGRPLYYYRDEGPGELRCHDVFHLGGTWLAVQPDGEPVPS